MDGFAEFIKLIKAQKNELELDRLLNLLLTPEEMEAIAKRVIIIEALLKKEKSQREIAKDFSLSIAKITRGSNALKRIDPKQKEKLIRHFK